MNYPRKELPMATISDKALEAIKQKEIQPLPKWQFTLRNIAMWLLFGISIVFGSIAISEDLFLFSQNEQNLQQRFGGSFLEYIPQSIPYVWLGLTIVFIILAYYNYRNTKHGYRLGLWPLLILLIGGSLLSGELLNLAGVPKAIDQWASKLPVYEQAVFHEPDIWHKPSEGYLSGSVKSIDNQKSLTITDSTGKEWIISLEEKFGYDTRLLENGQKIKLIGSKTGDQSFSARQVLVGP